MKAMIFAAGLGTRLKPLTETRPKALVEIGGKTLLERCISYLKSYGIGDITINVHHFPEQITGFLAQNKNFGIRISVSDESDALLDTGGGILHAKRFLQGDEPVLLINVDILTNLKLDRLLQAHEESGALASLVVRNRLSSRYLLFDRNRQLTGWKNVKTGELKISRPGATEDSGQLAFSGIHLICPELLDKVTESGKFSIIDLYLRLAETEKIIAFEDSESVWMDLGRYDDLEEAGRLIKQIEP
ncbi:nucleotidyltransferase family protein [Gaoshiqia sp. Z1-71]|uniref:nucleotidyltransferase family protein n=1 Tax=Gaoshiqia hydrogeniformans TaxID=3290090 RepID=UPI003BF86F20